MRHDVLGVTAAADDAENAVAVRELADRFADGVDFAGDLESGDVLGSSWRDRIFAEPLQHVGAVDGGRVDPNAHFASRRGGGRYIAEFENFRASGLANDDGAHATCLDSFERLLEG